MPSIRQDAWSHAEDVKLAEIILGCIREGGTQLAGFAEAGALLSRTPAACGFRWNSTLRQHYSEELMKAKVTRKALKGKNKTREVTEETSVGAREGRAILQEPEIDQMIAFLNRLKNKQSGESDGEKLETLLVRHEQLDQDYRKLEKEHNDLKRNYASLLRVLNLVDRARKQIPFEENVLIKEKGGGR